MRCDFCDAIVAEPDRAIVLRGSDDEPWELVCCDTCLNNKMSKEVDE